jgi:hypothetical protein
MILSRIAGKLLEQRNNENTLGQNHAISFRFNLILGGFTSRLWRGVTKPRIERLADEVRSF